MCRRRALEQTEHVGIRVAWEEKFWTYSGRSRDGNEIPIHMTRSRDAFLSRNGLWEHGSWEDAKRRDIRRGAHRRLKTQSIYCKRERKSVIRLRLRGNEDGVVPRLTRTGRPPPRKLESVEAGSSDASPFRQVSIADYLYPPGARTVIHHDALAMFKRRRNLPLDHSNGLFAGRICVIERSFADL